MKLTNKQLTDTNLNLTSLLEINARINAKKIKTTNISKKTHYNTKKLTTSIRSQSSRSFALQNALAKHLRQATKDKV